MWPFGEKIQENPRAELPEEDSVIESYGWTWLHLGHGTFRSGGDAEHPGPFILQRQEDRVERTNGGYLLRGWWFVTGPDRYEEEQVGLMTGSATVTEACGFVWKHITGRPWPRQPTRSELVSEDIREAIDEISSATMGMEPLSHEYQVLDGARDILERALARE